jgi:hypothetical protein
MKTNAELLDIFWQRGPGFEKIDDGTVGAFIEEVQRDAIEACAGIVDNAFDWTPRQIAGEIRKLKP